MARLLVDWGGDVSDAKPFVFLVAGNRLLRDTLAKLLNKKCDLNLCGVSPYLPDIASSIATARTDVLILDSVTAHLAECEFISGILNQVPGIKVLLIGMDSDPDVFLDCVRAGAVGYLLEDASAAEVVSAVQAIAQGQAVCPPQFSMHIFRALSRQWTTLPSARIKLAFGLTRRQQQLVPLLAQGLTNKEIATHLNVSEQTVKNHVHSILRRTGANDRLQVADLTQDRRALR